MTDKVLRELLISVKQQGAARVTKSIKAITDGLQDAAAGAELTNNELDKMPKTLLSVEKAADRAAKSMAKISANKGFKIQGLDKLQTSLTSIESSILALLHATEKMTGDVTTSIKEMGNDTGKVLERLEDRMQDTTKAVNGVGSSLGGLGGAAGRASRALGNTSGSARGAARNFAAMAKIGGTLPIMYAAIASNLYVLQAAFDQLKMGDQLNRLEQFGSIVGSKTGTPVQSLALALQEATGYAISFEESMKQASMASACGFDAKQIKEFGLVARRAAAVLGVDMTDALNRVIKGVSKQEIELLDELGVTIRLNDAYTAYVNKLNAANTGITYNINSLSTFQKQQAYANAVVAESTKRFGYLDEVLRATPWEQFAALADSALRKVQQAAAKYLGPTIASITAAFGGTQMAGSLEAAKAQQAAVDQMDVKDNNAVVMNISASQKGLDEAIAAREESAKRLKNLNVEIMKAENSADASTKLAIAANYQGLGNSMTIGASEANKAFVQKVADMKRMAYMLQREQEDSAKTIGAWQQTLNSAVSKAGKGNAEIGGKLGIQETAESSGGAFYYNKEALGGMVEINKEFSSIKKTSGDLATDIQNVANNATTASKATAALGEATRVVEAMSSGSAEKADEYVRDLNLGFKSLTEMKAAYSALDNYQKSINDESKNKLAVEQKIADVYASTKDKAKADAAGRALEAAQMADRVAKLQAVLATNKDNKSIQKELTELQTEQLKIQNQGMETAKKTKDRTDKILSVEKEIALLKNRTMTESQYAYARIKMEIAAEKEKYEWLSKQADRHVDAERSRVNIANLEREQWKAKKDMQSQTLDLQEQELRRSHDRAGPFIGDSQKLEEQLALYEKQKQATLGNAEAQKTLRDKIQDTLVAQEALNNSRKQQMMGMVGSSLGADYTPTTGLSGDDKAFADMGNKMASYDTAISKLSELNSEATAVAQSMGNLSNAMIQFSQGSLDTTSLIAAGMQSVSSMIAYGANQQVSAIDAAIAAEQARDGKSEASKNKIKKMEAEKLKIQQDAAKKQIIIQTAVAVMQAATAVPYPFSIPLMIAAGLAGAMSLAQASSASSMSNIAGSGGDTASYLTLGERQKNVDVSMSASAGESAYVRGDQGIGNANSFVPRAEGGNMYPGVSYKMGEHGTEIATPMVPMKVTPAEGVSGDSSSGSSGRPIALTIQAMDAQSFMDFALSNPDAFRKAVESSLNEQGQSLNNIR